MRSELPQGSPDRRAGGGPRDRGGDASAAAPRRRSRLLRRAGKGLALLLLGLVAAVVVALSVLQTDWGRERVRLFALERLRDQLRGEVVVERLGGDLLRGVTLHDVAIRGPGGDPFLTVERLEVSYDVSGFLTQEVLLGEVVLVRPTIRLVQDSSGTWNLTRILPEPDPASPGSRWGQVVRVEELKIREGTLLVASDADPDAFGPLGSRIELLSVNGTLGLDVERERGDDRQRLESKDLSFRLAEADLSVRELDARIERSPDGLVIERLLVRTPATELAADGRVRQPSRPAGSGGARERPVVDLAVRAEPLAFGDLRRFVPRLPPDGVLEGELHLAGPADSLTVRLERVTARTPRSSAAVDGRLVLAGAPAFEGRLEVSRLDPVDARAAYAHYPLDEPLTARVSAEGTRRRTELRAELAYPGTRLRAAGTVGMAEPQPAYDLTLEVEGLDLEDLLGGAEWSSAISGSARVEGVGRAATLVGSLADSRIRGYRVASADVRGRLRDDLLLLDTLAVRFPRSAFAASGTIELGGAVDLTFRGRGTSIEGFAPSGWAVPVGSFSVAGAVSGAPGSLTADLRGSADSLAVGGAVVDSVGIEASFTGIGSALTGTAGVAARDVRGPGDAAIERVELDARFTGGRGDVGLRVRADSLRSAAAHAEVRVQGAGAEVVVDSLTLALGDSVWRLAEGGRIAYAGGVLRAENAVLSRGGSRISLAGSADPGGRLDLRLELESVPVGELQALAGRETLVVGTASGAATLRGSAGAPLLDADLRLVDGRVGDVALRRAGGTFRYADRRLELDVEVVPGAAGTADQTGAFSLSGALPLDLAPGDGGARFPDAPLDLLVEARGVRMATVQPGDSLVVTGPLDARLEVGGRPSAPRLEGRFALADSRLGGFAVERLTGTLSYADQQLELEAELAPGSGSAAEVGGAAAPVGGVLTARARLPLDLSLAPAAGPRLRERPLEVDVESRGLTLRLLEAAVPGVTEASGALDVDVRVSGTPAAPRWDGVVAARDGSFSAGGTRYTGLAGALRFDNDQVVLEDLRVASPTGPASASGRVALSELVPGEVEARVTARDFTLLDQDEKEVVVDAALVVGGSARLPVVTGSVTVERLIWPLPAGGTDKDVIDLDEAILHVRTDADTARAREPAPSAWESARVALDVLVEDDAVLRSDKGLIVLAGDLTVTKARDEPRPSIAGALQVVRGEYRDFGRTFQVDEGEVRFFGTPDLNPALDVTASTTVRDEDSGRDVDVALEIGGTVEELAVDFSSVPAYDRSEILSLLLFGTPTPGAGQEERFRGTVTRIAASRAAAPLQGALADELGLDLLEIQPGLGAGDAGFRAGKYLAEDVFITYSQRAGPATESQFGIQYRVTDQFTLETQAGARQFGVDLYYEFDY